MKKKKISKKKYLNSPKTYEIGHWEGKYWCDCKTRNYRKWCYVKLYGFNE